MKSRRRIRLPPTAWDYANQGCIATGSKAGNWLRRNGLRGVHAAQSMLAMGRKPISATLESVSPLYPRKQTSQAPSERSASGQEQTHAPQQTASLFDHLVGADQNGIRDR